MESRAGSSPALRFVLGAFVMIGALAFLGCPLRMVLRLAGGDLNAVVGLAGFAAGIFLGTIFIRKGFTLQRNYATKTLDGTVLPAVMVGLLILFLAVPTLFKLSEEGPGSKHAPFLIALLIALVVGALAQKSRICMVGGLRDTMMFKDLLGAAGRLPAASAHSCRQRQRRFCRYGVRHDRRRCVRT